MGGEILRETGTHLVLVGVSIGIATAIGVPLGVILTRRPGWQRLQQPRDEQGDRDLRGHGDDRVDHGVDDGHAEDVVLG